MKRSIQILALTLIVSCFQKTENLSGIWKVESDYYSASFRITENRSKINAEILSYNDGTQKFKADSTEKRFLFENLSLSKGKISVDSSTGATPTSEKTNHYYVRKVNIDTLEITSFVLEQPLVEYWIRK